MYLVTYLKSLNKDNLENVRLQGLSRVIRLLW